MSQKNNPLILKIAFITLCTLLAYCYQIGFSVPSWIFSHISILWIMCVYRNLNKDRKISIIGEFMMGFMIRMGFGVFYNLQNSGKIWGEIGPQAFMYIVVELLIAGIIYASIPLQNIISIWQNKYLRWLIFIIDQTMTHGYKFIPLFKKQFLSHKYTNPMIPILIFSLKAAWRPISLAIAAYFNGNLTKDNNVRKWLKIGYLNIVRILILCVVNWVWLGQLGGSGSQGDLEFFNLCYYGFVGYLMYTQTYPKEQQYY